MTSSPSGTTRSDPTENRELIFRGPLVTFLATTIFLHHQCSNWLTMYWTAAGSTLIQCFVRSRMGTIRRPWPRWLAVRRKESRDRGSTLPSPLLAKLLDRFLAPLTRLSRKLYALTSVRGVRRLRWLRKAGDTVVYTLSRPYYHHKYVVHWAIDRAKERYSLPP